MLTRYNPQGTRNILDALQSCPCKIVQFAKAVRQEEAIDKVYRDIIDKTITGKTGEDNGDGLFNMACKRLLEDLGSGSTVNRQAHHDARKLLLLFSYFHPQDIWYGLVKKGQVDPGPPGADRWLERSTRSPLDFKERIEILIHRGFVAVDSVENIESARITIHDRLLKFLLQKQFQEDKEILRYAASCVAYSNCGDYHPQLYEIRTRLQPHAQSIRKHLEDHEEHKLRYFHFDELETKQQAIVRRMMRDEKDLDDDFIGFVNPLAKLAYLLSWNNKTGSVLKLVEDAYNSLKSPSMADVIKSHWTLLIAHLHYFDDNPDNYRPALRYTQHAVDVFSASERDIRYFYFATRLEIALKTRWGSSEEKAAALKDNDEVITQVSSALPNSVYFLQTLEDSGLILLENGLFERSARCFRDCFKMLRERLPPSNRAFVSLAAKAAITTVQERDTYLKTPETDEEKAALRRLAAELALEGFRECAGRDDQTTVAQARILAWIYDEEESLENCISVRKEIIGSLQRVPDSDPMDMAKEHKFLADILLKKNSTLSEDDEAIFTTIKESVNEGLKLIQLAHVEKDEKVLALQFGMASIFCEIYEYSAALPVLKQVLTCLKQIKGHSQSNMNVALAQLSDVYHKLSMTDDLDKLLREWAEPNIPLDDPSSALETLRKKATACMNYDSHEKAIPLLEKIQSYLTSLPTPPNTEILENRHQIAECLELTNRIPEAMDMYNSILASFEGKERLDTPERILRVRVFQGLGDIHLDRSERRLAASMYEKALEEVEACEDRQSSDVRYYEARILYHIAKAEWEIYLFQGAEPAVGVRARERFEKVLTFQDDSGRWILDDYQIGGTFYSLGFLDIANDRTAEAEQHLRKSLTYLCKQRPLAISSLEPPYHLLVRSLWEQISEPNFDKLWELFIVMLALLSRLGIFNSLPSDFADFSIAGLLTSDWAFSKTMPPNTADFGLQIISEFASIMSWTNTARSLAHTIFLKLLRTCEERFGPEDWRSRNALYLLEDTERLQSSVLGDDGSVYLTILGVLSIESGGTVRDLWSDPGPRPLANTDEPLSDEASRILVRLGKWQSAPAELNPDLKERLVYNPPPDTSGWPRSWTFIPDVAKLRRREKLDVPLRIADAPVIIPAPKRYPTVWSSIPPKDSHAPIDPSEPISVETIIDIFQVYHFAQGFFLLLNRRLQIVVDDQFNYSDALATKPIVFGGLKVDYVRNLMTHTSSHQPTRVETSSSHNSVPRLQINSTVTATKFKRPILGLFGRPIQARESKTARIGVRIRPKHPRNLIERERHLLTIPTHSFKQTLLPGKKPSGLWSSFRQFLRKEGAGVKVFEENSRRQIGTIAETFADDGIYTISGVLAPDISLVTPLRGQTIANIVSPINNLDWISDEDWKQLKRSPHQSLMILGANEIDASQIRTNNTARQGDCQVRYIESVQQIE
jgi:hypothetical protein